MNYSEYQPHPSLTNHIKCYWMLNSSEPQFIGKSQQFLTEGGVELTVNLADPFSIHDENDSHMNFQGGCVIGPMTKAKYVQTTGNNSLNGVCFLPGSASQFFQFPTIELTDRFIEIKDLWGMIGDELVTNLQNRRLQIQDRIKVLDACLVSMFRKKIINNFSFEKALNIIIKFKGQIPIYRVAQATNISRRQLERKFKERIGISPKTFSRLLRFKNVIHKIRNAEIDSWVSIAINNGYYDQPHLINEFQAFTGLTPSTYFYSRTSSNDVLSL